MKKFATRKCIPGRSKVKSKEELIKLLEYYGYNKEKIEKDDGSTKNVVRSRRDIKREFGRLPFEFSTDYLLVRLDEPVSGEKKITLVDGRVRKYGPRFEIKKNKPITNRDVIMFMKDLDHYKMMEKLAGDYQFLASFRKLGKGVYEANFDS